MPLSPQQLKANDEFFNRIASMTKMYAWPDTGHIYKIEDGNNFILGDLQQIGLHSINATMGPFTSTHKVTLEQNKYTLSI